MAAIDTVDDLGQERAGRRDSLRAHALEGVEPLHRRRTHRDRQQWRRACVARRCARAQELPVRGPDAGGERAAAIYSLLGTAERHRSGRLSAHRARATSPSIRSAGSRSRCHGVSRGKRRITAQGGVAKAAASAVAGNGVQPRLLSKASSVPKRGIQPASVILTKSTPIDTHYGARQPSMRRMVPLFTAPYAGKDLCVRRMRLIISA